LENNNQLTKRQNNGNHCWVVVEVEKERGEEKRGRGRVVNATTMDIMWMWRRTMQSSDAEPCPILSWNFVKWGIKFFKLTYILLFSVVCMYIT
jgi:hypothetical protein